MHLSLMKPHLRKDWNSILSLAWFGCSSSLRYYTPPVEENKKRSVPEEEDKDVDVKKQNTGGDESPTVFL